MELLEGIRTRRSVRSFDGRPLDRATLERALEAAKWTPAPRFMRRWEIHVVEGEDLERAKTKIRQNTDHLKEWVGSTNDPSPPDAADMEAMRHAGEFYGDLGGAPALLLVVARTTPDAWLDRHLDLRSGTLVQNLLLAIHAAGLGACGILLAPWVEREVLNQLGLSDRKILASIVVGHPKRIPEPPEMPAPPVFFHGSQQSSERGSSG